MHILEAQLYLIYMIGIMIITGIIKDKNLFTNIYFDLSKAINNDKILLVIVAAITGILPVPGRCIISASILDTLSCKSKKFGIVDYLSTHHYYLWSPLEKTIILPMAAFGLSWIGIMQYTWPILLLVLVYTFYYIYKFVKPEDINIKPTFDINISSWLFFIPLLVGIICMMLKMKPWIIFSILPLYYIFATKTLDFKKILSYINFKLLIGLSIVLLISSFCKLYSNVILQYIKLVPQNLIVLSIIAFVAAFVLGSSAKFAGIVIILCSIFGLKYLTFFIALEYSAYLLSPMHKCMIISKEYFGTSLKEFYSVIGGMVLLILLIGIITII
jgi:hypothetical protein